MAPFHHQVKTLLDGSWVVFHLHINKCLAVGEDFCHLHRMQYTPRTSITINAPAKYSFTTFSLLLQVQLLSHLSVQQDMHDIKFDSLINDRGIKSMIITSGPQISFPPNCGGQQNKHKKEFIYNNLSLTDGLPFNSSLSTKGNMKKKLKTRSQEAPLTVLLLIIFLGPGFW